jgi:hypothetical protein
MLCKTIFVGAHCSLQLQLFKAKVQNPNTCIVLSVFVCWLHGLITNVTKREFWMTLKANNLDSSTNNVIVLNSWTTNIY